MTNTVSLHEPGPSFLCLMAKDDLLPENSAFHLEMFQSNHIFILVSFKTLKRSVKYSGISDSALQEETVPSQIL